MKDIFKWAEDYNYLADYMDPSTGYIYHVQNYGLAMRRGLPTPGIEVTDSFGNFVKYVTKEEN